MEERQRLLLGLLHELDDEMELASAIAAAASTAVTTLADSSTYHIINPGVCRELHEMNKDYVEHLHSMDEDTFYQYMQMDKEIFQKLLDRVGPHLPQPIPTSSGALKGRERIKSRDALTMTICYLVSKITFREIGNLFGLHRAAANRKFHEVIGILCSVLEKELQWPDSPEVVETAFTNAAGFPGVIGAIDTVHFKVLAPVHEQESYNNRKQEHTIGTIAVADDEKRFLYAFIGYPGSIDDQEALDSCSLGYALRKCPNDYIDSGNYHILANPEFNLQVNIMTPYRDRGNLSNSQKMYNTKHAQMSKVVKSAFELLNSKFKCLEKLEVDVERASSIVRACMLLHNFILNNTLPERSRLVNAAHCFENMEAARKRDCLANLL